MTQTIQNYNGIFWNLVKEYDLSESNILRKFIHSFDVAKNCFSLACHENFSVEERNLCYLMGLMHDIGRFEQWKIYQTYNDRKSVDHGDLSFEILQKLNCEKLFNITARECEILTYAIKFHTKPYHGEDEDIIRFNSILKDSDAYSNVVTTANGMQQMTVEQNGVTKELMEDFLNQKLLINYSPNTKLDRSLMLSACCYYVKNKFFRQQILDSNYINIIFETFSRYLNDEDKATFKKALDYLMLNYLKD